MLFLNDSDKRPYGMEEDDKGKSRPRKKPIASTVDLKKPGLGRIYCPPGKTVEIPDVYARPRRADNGDRIPPAIETLAPQLRPADPKEWEEWQKTPAPAQVYRRKMGEPVEIPSIDELVAKGIPAGVARSQIARMMADRQLAADEAGEDQDDEDEDDKE
jgi:hypothetical protein